MKAPEAYDLVLKQYDLKARSIALTIGKSEADVSKFRNGHRKINHDLLQLLIQALPVEARAQFYILYCCGNELEEVKVAK